MAKTATCAVFALLLFALFAFPVRAAEVELPTEMVVGDAIDEAVLDKELSPGAVSVVRPEHFEGEMKDLPQMLERIPGLHIVRSRGRGGYSVASVRGSTSAQVSVYVDGVLMNLGSESAVDLSTIPVDNVEKIEVYRGYIPARFGASSMGGVINIVTKKPGKDGKSSTVSAGFGSYGLWKVAASHSDAMGDGYYFIGFNHESSDGDFKYDNDNGTPYNPDDDYRAKRQNNDYANSELLFKWQNDSWRTRISWVKNDRTLPYSAPGADRADSPRGADMDTEKLEFSLGKRHAAGMVDWGWQVEYLHQDKEYNDPNDTIGGWGEQHNRYKTERYRIAADASAAIGERHFVEFYAGYYDEKLKVDGDIVNALNGSSKMSEQNLEVSIQDTISLTADGSLLLIPSLRWNRDSNDDDLTWQIAINKDWFNGWYAKGSYGTYARSPNLYERYGDGASIRPNTDLEWESGTQWDLGFGWRGNMRRGTAYAELTYFMRDSDNLIEYVMTSPRFGVYQNIGEARVNGVELEFGLDWENGWNIVGSGTWMDTEDRTSGSYRSGHPLPNRPEWSGLLRLGKKWNPHLSSFAEVQYIGENYYDLTGDVQMSDLTLFNLGTSYLFDNGMKLTVGVDDLLDEGPETQFVSSGGNSRTMWYPLQGRTIYMNFTWTF